MGRKKFRIILYALFIFFAVYVFPCEVKATESSCSVESEVIWKDGTRSIPPIINATISNPEKLHVKEVGIIFLRNGAQLVEFRKTIDSNDESSVVPFDIQREFMYFLPLSSAYEYTVFVNIDDVRTGLISVETSGEFYLTELGDRRLTITFLDGTKQLRYRGYIGEAAKSLKGKSFIPKKKGYTFIGWYADKNFRKKINFSETVSETRMYLYARFEKNPPNPLGFQTRRVRTGQIRLSWSKKRGYTYALQMSTRKKKPTFKTFKTTTAGAFVRRNLIKGQMYYFRVSRYKKVSNVNVKSGWSAIRMVRA